MKRKHSEGTDAAPTAAVEEAEAVSGSTSFQSLGLDARLLQGIAKLGFSEPTVVQAKAVALALDGKDILARAKTGSGKTAAYLLPILQSILKNKEVQTEDATTTSTGPSALVLVPTRELADQVHKSIERLAAYCGKAIKSTNIAQNVSEQVQQSLLAESPDIVVSTPSRALTHINVSKQFPTANLTHLVIDEADLVLSYGYEDDLTAVSKALPKGIQTFLASATLTTEVETLKKLFCRAPVILKVSEEDEEKNGASAGGVSQYAVKCAEDEKFLLLYVIFKLRLIKGKCIIFVGDIDRCYRVRLFLEQFGIRACVLNSELPVNSRLHIVEEFNKNVYDIIIATDENEVMGDEVDDDDLEESTESKKAIEEVPAAEVDEEDEEEDAEKKEASAEEKDDEKTEATETKTSDATPSKTDKKSKNKKFKKEKPAAPPSKKRRKVTKRDKEYGVSRGIDFHNVSCVLNFDLPSTSRSYTHRIGRTARAGRAGMALSFVIPTELFGKHKPTSNPACANDEKILARIKRHQERRGKSVNPYIFDMKQVDAFRYRMEDALRAVTKVKVREARLAELRSELVKSEKLKRWFEENPGELKALRHDVGGGGSVLRLQPHLKHVPDYLLPKSGAESVVKEKGGEVNDRGREANGFVGLKKHTDNRIRRARMKSASNRKVGLGAGAKGKGGRDPLKTFKAKR